MKQLLLALLLFAAGAANAANHYIRAGGTNTGQCTAGWATADACNSLPNSLIRGDTYYLADGAYGSYVFDDANSGTSAITIKKAIASDHGTDTGWVSTYGDGQAIFTGSWQFHTDYYVIDGQVRNGDWATGGINQYGIRLKASSRGPLVELDNRFASANRAANNITFRYIDFEHLGRDLSESDDIFYGNAWALSPVVGPHNIVIQYCAMHDLSRVVFTMRQWDTLLVEYSYMARNSSDPVVHAEIASDDGSDNVTFRYNVIEDPEGTAVWAVLNGSGSKSATNTATNWEIYGNVILHTATYQASGREGISGVVFVAGSTPPQVNWVDNWKIYNNTIVNIRGTWSGFVLNAGTGNVVYNNLWYNSVRTNNNTAAFDYNWYYNTVADGDKGVHTVVCTANCGIFASLTSKDFDLIAETPPGTTLPAPYNLDLDGVVRGSGGVWSRGAYQFSGSTVSLPAPTNLRIVQ